MTYGKIFEAIYASTVADDWRALVTLQQLITLADKDGVVLHSARSLSRLTGIPLDIIEPGIEILLSTDPSSQSKSQEGRRIVPLPEEDGRQPIGWILVNYEYYRNLGSRYESKEKARIRKQRQRERDKSHPGHACHDHTDTDTDKNLKDIVDYLNQKTGKKFKPVKSNLKFIQARISEGHNLDDLKAVVDRKVQEWKGDSKMEQYLRPATLFNAEKFNQYIAEVDQPLPKADSKPQDWEKVPYADDELVAWAKKHSFPKPGNTDTYRQYRTTLLSLVRKRQDQEGKT